jgi:hypothetical protein
MNSGRTVLASTLALSVVVLSACGTPQVDTSAFVDSVNKQLRQSLASVPRVAETGAAVEMSCPAMVEEGKAFVCTVSGELSGKSVTVRLTTKPTADETRDDVVPVSQSAVDAAFDSVSEAEGRAAGRIIAEGK